MSWPATAALCALAVALAPQAAAASDFFEVEAPESFPANEPLGKSVAREAGRAPHFGEQRATESGADAYAAQGEGALYVWWAVGAPTETPESAIRAALDRIRRGPTEASPQAGSVAIDAWEEELQDGVAGAELAWRHLSNETLTLARALAFADPDGTPRLVTAECVMHVSREDEVRPICEQALASLAITVDASRRAELGELPEGEPVEVAASVPDFELDAEEAGPAGEEDGAEASEGPKMDVPEDGVIYEERDSQDGDDSPPWLLLVGALLVVGAVYLIIRQRSNRDRAAGDSESEGSDEDDERQD